MIGAMPAVAVRHERRKQKKSGVFSGILPDRHPTHIVLKPRSSSKAGLGLDSPQGPPGVTPTHSRSPSPTHKATHYLYGDECCYGKVSLLHFIIFFLMGGLTMVVIGAVQFKQEAGLAYLKYHFLFAGAILLTVGIVLIVVKCIWFRVAYPIITYLEDEAMSTNDEHHAVKSKSKSSPKKSIPSPASPSGVVTSASASASASKSGNVKRRDGSKPSPV